MTFDDCLEWVLDREGGFVDNPADPGGATNMGITIKTLSTYRGYAVTVDDIKNLTRNNIKHIYNDFYWLPIHGDDLPDGVDLVMFDHAVTSGPSSAVKLLQHVVCTKPDGIMGPITMAAVHAANTEACILSLSTMRRGFYCDIVKNRPESQVFLRGWLARVTATRTKALEHYLK